MNDPSISIHPQKRVIRCNSSFSAFLRTGTDKIRSGFGNGDCLLMDPAAGVFAVADASERHPRASRRLLQRLVRIMADHPLSPGSDSLREVIGNAFSGQEYVEKTTLCCIKIASKKVLIANGGDSMAIVFDGRTGAIKFKTRSDMNFAGRSNQAVKVIEYELEAGADRILLATDGLGDLLRHMACKDFKRLPDAFYRRPFHNAGVRIHGLFKTSCAGIEHDDIGLIVIHPFHMKGGKNVKLLVGGTSASEEKKCLGLASEGGCDEWLPVDSWEENRDLLSKAGCSIEA